MKSMLLFIVRYNRKSLFIVVVWKKKEEEKQKQKKIKWNEKGNQKQISFFYRVNWRLDM